jgi:hypothetical protein
VATVTGGQLRGACPGGSRSRAPTPPGTHGDGGATGRRAAGAAPRGHSWGTGAAGAPGGATAGTTWSWGGGTVGGPHRGLGPAAAACTSPEGCSKKPSSLRPRNTHTAAHGTLVALLLSSAAP